MEPPPPRDEQAQGHSELGERTRAVRNLATWVRLPSVDVTDRAGIQA